MVFERAAIKEEASDLAIIFRKREVFAFVQIFLPRFRKREVL